MSLFVLAVSFGLLAANGLRLGEGGDFYHKTCYEAVMFKFTKNCQTKNVTPACAKPLLAVRAFLCKFLVQILSSEFVRMKILYSGFSLSASISIDFLKSNFVKSLVEL